MDMKKNLPRIILITIVIISLFFMVKEWAEEREKQEAGQGPFMDWVKELVMEPYLPAIRRINEDKGSSFQGDLLTRGVLWEYPVVLFYLKEDEEQAYVTESDYARLLVLEGSDEDRRAIKEGDLEYGEDAMHLEQSMENELLKENERYLLEQPKEREEEKETEEAIQFVPVEEKSFHYQWEELTEYEDLIKAFYAVDSTTYAGAELLQAKELLSKDMRMRGNADKPQILIYHTHSQEAFADSQDGETIVAVGTYLTQLLEEKGFAVYHDCSVYDVRDGKLDRNKAYSYALEGITRILEQHPSIEVVIDLHRDGVREGTHLAAEVNGKSTAQIMFFNGLSQTPTGPIPYLDNPYLEENLAFSLQLQLKASAWYPNFTRKIYLKGLRYNLHLRPRSCLIEAGAQTNTYEEVKNAMEPLSEVLAMVLEGK